MSQSKPEFKLDEILENLYLEDIRIALLIANWNMKFNEEMANSARETLVEFGIRRENIDTYYVPGAFEMPYVCKKLFEIELTDEAEDEELDSDLEEDDEAEFLGYHAAICFATVIRGETYHFEIVANESARGIMDVMLEFSKPIINGILTVNNEEQAYSRAAVAADNKGRELALSCLQVLAV